MVILVFVKWWDIAYIYIDYDQLKIYIINFLQTTKISLNCGSQLMSQQSWWNGIINNML